MKKILILYWPAGGSVHKCAELMHKKLDTQEADLIELSEFDLNSLGDYDLFILGGSTVGAETWQAADTIDEWNPFFVKMVNAEADLKGKKVALFGLGNQVLYPDHFINSMKIIFDELSDFGPSFIGRWPAKDYSFNDSDALDGDEFLGLALDEDTEGHLTDQRIDNWLAQLLEESSEG